RSPSRRTRCSLRRRRNEGEGGRAVARHRIARSRRVSSSRGSVPVPGTTMHAAPSYLDPERVLGDTVEQPVTTMHAAPNYLNPDLPADLQRVRMPVVAATAAALDGYGCLVDDPSQCRIEIVRWPAQGSRPVDPDSGDEGGTTEGVFV